MADVILKAPWVAPGCVYLHATEPHHLTNIPDAWVKEVPEGTIIINESSPDAYITPRQPGTLLREHDWLRGASSEEEKEILRLRQPDATAPVRRNNVIPGSKA